MKIPSDTSIKTPDGDLLDFFPFAQNLSMLLSAVNPPYTIGVFGEWGSGKSTILNFCLGDLQNRDEHVIPVWFDAWRYDGQVNLLYPLFQELTRSLSNSDDRSPNLKRIGKVLLLALANSAAGLLNQGTGIDLSVPTLSELGELAEKSESQAHNWFDEVRALQGDLSREIDELLERYANRHNVEVSKLRIALFVDDLDRCSPSHALHLLEGIHLFFDLPRLIVVLAVSPSTMSQGVKAKYGVNLDLEQTYFQKLVQLDVAVPEAKAKQDHYITQVAKRIFDPQVDGFVSLSKRLANACQIAGITNPRILKRLVSKLAANYAMAEKCCENDIKKNEFVALLVLKHAHPEAYSYIMADLRRLHGLGHVFTRAKENVALAVSAHGEGSSKSLVARDCRSSLLTTSTALEATRAFCGAVTKTHRPRPVIALRSFERSCSSGPPPSSRHNASGRRRGVYCRR